MMSSEASDMSGRYNQSFRRFVFLWLALVCILFHPGSTFVYWNIKEAIIGAGAAVLVTFWLVISFKRGAISIPQNGLLPVLAAVALWSAISFALSDYKAATLTILARLCWIAALILPLVSAFKTGGARKFSRSVCYIGMAGSIYALMQYFDIDFFKSPFGPAQRMFSFFGGKNFTAGFMALLMPLIISELMLARSNLEKLLPGLTGLLGFSVIFLARSETAVLALGTGLIYMIWKAVNRRAALVVTLAGLCVFLLLNMNIYDNNVALRLYIWRIASAMTADAPFFGHGPGSFGMIFTDYQKRLFTVYPDYPFIPPDLKALQAHNEFLNVASEIGIPGMLLCCIPVAWLLFKGVKYGKMSCRRRLIAAAYGGSVTGFTALCIGDFPLHIPSHGLLFLITTSIFAGFASYKVKVYPVYRRILPAMISLLSVSWLVFSCFRLEWRIFRADILAADSLEGMKYKPAAESIRLNPRNGQALFFAGRALIVQRRYMEAAEKLMLASLYASDAGINGALGQVLRALGDLNGARMSFRTASLMLPGNPVSRLRWATLEALTGDGFEARRQGMKALKLGIPPAAVRHLLRQIEIYGSSKLWNSTQDSSEPEDLQ